jgi:hypothetical protein
MAKVKEACSMGLWWPMVESIFKNLALFSGVRSAISWSTPTAE